VTTHEDIKTIWSDPKSGLFERVAVSCRHYAVALIALASLQGPRSPEPSGIGTLTRTRNDHYILTATHVWKRLRQSKHVGITLTPGVNQLTPIPSELLIPAGPPARSDDWGPDLVFLKIPPSHVGGIAAKLSFYHLEHRRRRPRSTEIEARILLGAPGEFATLSPGHLDLTIQAINADSDPNPYVKRGFDYIDLKEYAGAHGFPSSYRGFSGGGLWRVSLFRDKRNGEIDWMCFLEGVAFRESDLKNGYRIIRCHGPRSIRIAITMLRQGNASH
jgi:hypothetical protein